MGTIKFALQMLKREYIKSISYSFILLFSLFISFIFIDIIDNPYLVQGDTVSGGASWNQVSVPLSIGLPFLIICICWVMILYASDYYLNKKVKEFALIYISGGTFIDVVLYVACQITVILIITIPLSFLLGTIALNQLYTIMYQYLNINIVYHVPFSTYFGCSFTIIPIIMTIMISIAGFSHRNTIQVLLGRTEKASGTIIKDTKIKTPVYIFIYFAALISIVFQEHYAVAYVVPTFLGSFAMYGIIKQVIPKVVRQLNLKKLLEKPFSFIPFSNYCVSMQGTIIMSMLMLCLITLLVPILIGQDPSSNEYFTAILSYISIVILIIVGLVCKFCDLVVLRKGEFIAMAKIGYIYQERKNMIIKEVMIFYGTILVMPLPYILIIGLKFVIAGGLSTKMLFSLILFYVFPSLLSMIVTMYLYNRTVNIKVKGEVYE
ncbi:hypothetical protein [Tannockella kyphosi]|uniref:hypothetical protein n=1 Tax=Tannockella kyphosi TaxID=2899121 RepID=UPI0020126E64|nr:hypothetical protein [Tannockella kyphosi]